MRTHRPWHLFHVTPSFAPGGAQVRMAHLMNRFGDRFRHTVVALDGDRSAAALVGSAVAAHYPECAKSANPVQMAARLAALMRRDRPDLVLTYNWGSIDAVVAARLCGLPVIHTEDGFNHDEARGQKRRRIWARRFLLRGAARVVAPSHTLIAIMRRDWKLPAARLQYIANGIDLDRFQPAPANYRRQLSSAGELVIGTVGHLRPEKQQERLIEACARLAARYRLKLLIVGDGSERNKLEATARACGLADRVLLLGRRQDVERLYWEFDVFALSSSTEQMPLSVLEAMACGLPVLSTDVGDIARMVSPENRRAVVATMAAFEQELETLLAQAELRRRLGKANRTQCERQYSLERMAEQYWSLYHAALGYRVAPPLDGLIAEAGEPSVHPHSTV